MKRPAGLFVALLAAALTAGCGGESAPPSAGESGPIVVYSGRNESLVGPLLERYEAATGGRVRVRYGGTAELAATLFEEGERTPADLFLSQDAAALGALSDAGRLVALPAELLDRVAERFRSGRGDWVGLSGRARVVVYNTDRVAPEDLPKTLEEVAEPRFRSRFGVAPTNGSFQAHMAVYRVVAGERALTELLDAMVANRPQRYPKNSAIVEAVIAGEVDWGLSNHYYLWRALEQRPDAPAANAFLSGGVASGFVNVAGAGILRDSEAARALLAFLLGEEAQSYFATETFEYPLSAAVAAPDGMPALADLASPAVDFGRVSEALPATLEAIAASGLVE